MVKRALMGLWATCVLLTLNSSATSTATSDVVLYSSDSANLHGNWARVSDTTAAGGQLMASVDKGWASTGATLAAPTECRSERRDDRVSGAGDQPGLQPLRPRRAPGVPRGHARGWSLPFT